MAFPAFLLSPLLAFYHVGPISLLWASLSMWALETVSTEKRVSRKGFPSCLMPISGNTKGCEGEKTPQATFLACSSYRHTAAVGIHTFF